jgi:peptidyl-prolyl cis-trans isomerase A (cyclophilin A)
MNLFGNISLYKTIPILLVMLLAGALSCKRSPATLVSIRTNLGDMVVEVYPDKAPITAANFLEHVEKGTYTNSCFYRVVRMDNQPFNEVKIEVIQGGLFEDRILDTIPTIIHETTEHTGIQHSHGVLSMARMEPGSASTEFFICIGDQSALDFGGKRNPDGQGFAAFGKVIKGMGVARAIQALPDEDQFLLEKVVIQSMEIISAP